MKTFKLFCEAQINDIKDYGAWIDSKTKKVYSVPKFEGHMEILSKNFPEFDGAPDAIVKGGMVRVIWGAPDDPFNVGNIDGKPKDIKKVFSIVNPIMIQRAALNLDFWGNKVIGPRPTSKSYTFGRGLDGTKGKVKFRKDFG